MTVNELIGELSVLAYQGKGEYEVNILAHTEHGSSSCYFTPECVDEHDEKKEVVIE